MGTGHQQEFTPPQGNGTGIISEEDKLNALARSQAAVTEEDKELYLTTYSSSTQAARDNNPILSEFIGTRTAKELDNHYQSRRPKWWQTGLKVTGYIAGTLGMHWLLGKISNRRSNSVKKA
jgi:hypothetical protein